MDILSPDFCPLIYQGRKWIYCPRISPLSGYERIDLASPPVRFLTLSGFPYIIVYDAALSPPVILRFLHGARDLPDILREL